MSCFNNWLHVYAGKENVFLLVSLNKVHSGIRLLTCEAKNRSLMRVLLHNWCVLNYFSKQAECFYGQPSFNKTYKSITDISNSTLAHWLPSSNDFLCRLCSREKSKCLCAWFMLQVLCINATIIFAYSILTIYKWSFLDIFSYFCLHDVWYS